MKTAIVSFCLLLWLAIPSRAEGLNFQLIEGAGGVPISVVEWGNRDGPGILFIHGFQQSYLSWKKQFESDLADEFHMVAYDLRGHGASGKPWEGEQYTDTKKWADDIDAVMKATGLDKPVAVAWSYGGVVIGDYIRHYGTSSLKGINLVGTDGRFVERPPLDPETLKQREAQFALTESLNMEDNLVAARAMVDFLTAKPFEVEWRETVLAYNMGVPVYALKALTKRPLDNSDVAAGVEIPVLISWGTQDAVMNETMAEALVAAFSTTQLSRYDGLGHSPFFEDAERFDAELADFVRSVN